MADQDRTWAVEPDEDGGEMKLVTLGFDLIDAQVIKYINMELRSSVRSVG